MNPTVFSLLTRLLNEATPTQLDLAIRAMELAVDGRLASILSVDQIQGLNSILAGSKVLPLVSLYTDGVDPLGNPGTDPMDQLFSGAGGKAKPYFGPSCPEHGKVKYNQIHLQGDMPTCKIDNCGQVVEGPLDLDKIKSWQFDPKAGQPTTIFKSPEQTKPELKPQPESKPGASIKRDPRLALLLDELKGKKGKLWGTMLYNHLKKKGITTLGGALEYYHSGNCKSTRLKRLLENWLKDEGTL